MVIGITGGFGSGKSLAGTFWAEWGAFRVDTDAIARQILEGDERAREEVRQAFGSEVLRKDGGISRERLAQVVFGCPEKLQKLENILHPPIRQGWEEAIAQASPAVKVVEIPLLFEKKLELCFNFVVCISVSLTTQLARLKAAGWTESEVHARNARQMPLAEKVKLADYVISNNGSIEFTRQQVFLLAGRLNLI